MLANGKLIKNEAVAEGTMAFHFATPQGFEFRAGQFADSQAHLLPLWS